MKRYIVVAGIGVLGFLAACKEDEHIKITGDIVGFVKLFDEYGVELADKSNVTVLLNQTGTATTDKSGRFEFLNLEPGTFKFEFQKEGFSSTKTYNFIFVGGSKPAVIYNINLITLPKIEVKSKDVSVSGNLVTISGTMTQVNRYYFRYYFSDKPDVSNENYVSESATSFCCSDVSQFQHQASFYALTSSVYMVAYAISPAGVEGAYDYYDLEKGVTVNPAGKKLFEPVKIK